MAEALKHIFTEEFVQKLGQLIQNQDKDFDIVSFKKSIFNKDWISFELKDRMHHITDSLNASMNYEYLKQLKVLRNIADQFDGFPAMVFPNFVERYGLAYENESLDALHYFTRYSSAEFAIRPFLIQNPSLIGILLKWSKDENHHVRRLASEGCRPLLPWAMRLNQYVDDPVPIIPILDNLKNDNEDYVYRSVANNLNDISKNHPKLVLALAKKWYGKAKNTDWLVKHSLRTLLKQGNQEAMKIFGFGDITSIEIQNFKLCHNQIEIGGSSYFSFNVNYNDDKAKFRFEYSIEYMKKNGSLSEKVFQIKEVELIKNQKLNIQKSVDFKDLSTRKHYKGIHYLNLKVNGIKIRRSSFELI